MSTTEDERRAKLYTDLSEVVTYLSRSRSGMAMPDFRRWRAPDAVAGVGGFLGTVALTVATLGSGYARYVLVLGLITTVMAVIALGRLPKFGPTGLTRTRWWLEARSPRTTCTHSPSSLAGRTVDPRTGRLAPITKTTR